MDIEKLKTDPSLWPEGAEYCAFLQEKDHAVTDFFKDGVVIIPRPKDQKMEELKPRDLACFKEVAEVIGEENAEVELQKVIDKPRCRKESLESEPLVYAFIWGYSPQRVKFWNTISLGINPYELSEKAPQKSDKGNKYQVECRGIFMDVYGQISTQSKKCLCLASVALKMAFKTAKRLFRH